MSKSDKPAYINKPREVKLKESLKELLFSFFFSVGRRHREVNMPINKVLSFCFEPAHTILGKLSIC
jgi:hypothetical protein